MRGKNRLCLSDQSTAEAGTVSVRTHADLLFTAKRMMRLRFKEDGSLYCDGEAIS